MKMKLHGIVFGISGLLFMSCSFCFGAAQATPAAGTAQIDTSKPRLVMVRVPHWKVKFFGLPEELPVLMEPGESFNPGNHTYDFSAGLQAMEVYANLRPQDHATASFRLFQEKWPIYQKFFTAVDNEKFDAARGYLEQILKLDAKEPAVHFYLGSMHTQFGEYAEAEKEYKTCLSLYPGYGPAYINLSRLAMARQAKAEAAGYLHQALEHMDDSEQAGSRSLAEQMLKNLESK